MMLAEYEKLSQSLQLTLAARFLYGGITEEILLRFGLMTLIVWLALKCLKEQNLQHTGLGLFWLHYFLPSDISLQSMP
jgi:hypothetical protein